MPMRDVNSRPRTFANLDADECWRLVGEHGIGQAHRIALPVDHVQGQRVSG